MLKNEKSVLPITSDKYQRILVVGENAIKMMTVGGGSSSLKVQREVLPLDGLQSLITDHPLPFTLEYVRGYVGDTVQSYNGVTVGRSIAEHRTPAELRAEAVEKARMADVVIVFGGLNKSDFQDCEGHDRRQYELPYEQNELVEALAQVNRNIVFVNISGNAVAMPWIDRVPAVVQGWFIGSEAGHALADVLTGRVNPSGKLPFTWFRQLNDVGALRLGTYPGTWREGQGIIDEEYKEDIFVGYRWADRQKIKPLFAFGHGLSYTTFNVSVNGNSGNEVRGTGNAVSVNATVTNTGTMAGAETIQLYVSDRKSSVVRPVKELKAFQKVFLQPGESKTVTLTIDRRALSFWNELTNEWTAEPGDFDLMVGTASDAIVGKIRYTLR